MGGKVVHGMAKSRSYNIWVNLRQRCNNVKNPAYNDYGGRGINVCPRWDDSFQEFLMDMGECPEGMTIDRIDNDSGYSRENCRWTTMKEQNRNRRDNRLITHDGDTKTLAEWAESAGIKLTTLWARLETHGWDFDKAISAPVKAWNSRS